MKRRSAAVLAMFSIVSFGCGDEPPVRSASKPAAAAPARAARVATRATPRIVSVTPSTVSVRDGRAEAGAYYVEYEIENVDLVTKAELIVYAPGVGQLQRLPISPRERDTVSFDLDGSRDFGPTIAFRAQCPDGETDWYTLGSERVSSPAPAPAGLQITNVSPDYISLDRALIAGNGDIAPGSGVSVTIFGPLLTPDCTPSATVNGRAVELHNIFSQRKQIKALLSYQDIGNRYVSARYLEVKLSVHGAGFGLTSIERIRFVE